jgi:exosortase/archaeosortase family protein
LTLYGVIFKYHPELTSKLYGYQTESFEPYFVYLFYPILILFTIVKWKDISSMKPYKNCFWQTTFFSLLAAVIFLFPLKELLIKYSTTNDIIPHQFIYYFPLFLGFTSLFVGIFNTKFIKKFESELFLLIYTVCLYLIAQVLIEKFWVYFSNTILFALGYILPLFSKAVTIDPSELMVSMEGFSVNIGATCSGIYSLTTFAFLFVASVIMIQKKAKVDMLKTVIALIAGLVMIFVLNIIRIAIIIIIGAFYSPELAIELFHEYLSAVFLIGLFVIYLYFIFPKIIQGPRGKNSH